MEWIKKETRLPDEEKDGTRVETFSPIYPEDSEMRHRIMNSQFVRICKEVTHWRKLDEPCDGKNVDASENTLPIQNVSVSFLSEGMANKIYKQIGLLAEKQGGITGITTLNQLPSWLQNFMKELAADYGRQIDFLKSVLANER